MCGTLKQQPKTVDEAVQYAITFALEGGWTRFSLADLGRPEVLKVVRVNATSFLRRAWVHHEERAVDAVAQLAQTPDAELSTRFRLDDIFE